MPTETASASSLSPSPPTHFATITSIQPISWHIIRLVVVLSSGPVPDPPWSRFPSVSPSPVAFI